MYDIDAAMAVARSYLVHSASLSPTDPYPIDSLASTMQIR
jgi:hypothetical protein